MTDRQFALMGSGFALGLMAGLLMKGGAKEAVERMRRFKTHRDYERTVEYDENLPDSLGRREPAPHPGRLWGDRRPRASKSCQW